MTDLRDLRVVQLIPSLFTGGLERVATLLTIGLEPDVGRIVVCSRGGEPFEAVLREAGIAVEHVPRPRSNPARVLVSARAVARVLRRERPDVLHAHNPAAGAVAALARLLARQRRLAIVTTYHGVAPGRTGRASRALALTSDVVVGVSPGVTRTIHGDATIYNAVDASPSRSREEVRRELGIPADAHLVITVGRYEEEKNQALLLDAVARLDRPDVHALVVGVGTLEDELRRRAGPRVQITGQRNDVYDLMAAADVFVLSSDWEAMPLVLIEALAVGCPIVSTRVPGAEDLLADGETALLVPVGDAPALAAAIARVLDDPDLAARLVSRGLTLARERCSERAMVEAYETLYVDAHRRRANAKPSV